MAKAVRSTLHRGTADANRAGLNWSDPDTPGWRRQRQGKGWIYIDERGRQLPAAACERLAALSIPPAWQEVWFSPDPRGHIQAVGTDGAGRRQYRYHPEWRAMRDRAKFADMEIFSTCLPRLRRKVARSLNSTTDEEELALAAIVRLLDKGALRIGKKDRKASFGAVSLRDRHLDTTGNTLALRFKAKGGKERRVAITDALLANAIEMLQDLPGQRLFALGDKTIASHHVNDYIKACTGKAFTAKDFRTWAGSVAATDCLMKQDRPTIKAVSEAAARRLGNTPAIAKKSYVHPQIIAHARHGLALPPSAGPTRLRKAERQLVGLIACARRDAS